MATNILTATEQVSVLLGSIATLADQLNALGAETVEAACDPDDGERVTRLGVSIRELGALVGFQADHAQALLNDRAQVRGGADEWLLPPVLRRAHGTA